MRSSGHFLTLGFSSVAHTYSHLFTLFYATAVLAIEREWQVGYDTLIALAIPMNVLFGLGALPAGWAADRWGAAPLMTLFFLGVGAGSLVTGLAESQTGLLLGLATVGLFASIYHPVGIPWLIKHAVNRGRALAVNGLFGSLGIAGSALVAGLLIELWSWRAVFVLPGLVCVATGLAFMLSQRLGHIVEAAEDVVKEPIPAVGDVRRAFIILSITMVATGLFVQLVTIALPKIFDERMGAWLGESAFGVGALVAAVYAIGVIGQLIGGEFIDRMRLRTAYMGFMAAVGPAVLIAYLDNRFIMVGGLGMAMALLSTASLAENALLSRYTPSNWRGRAFGAKFVLSLGVGTIGVALVPLVYRLSGNLDGVFFILIACVLIGAIAAWAMPRDRTTPASPAVMAAAE